jgi:uncharacterized membrane protein YeiB
MIKNIILMFFGLIGFSILIGLSYDKSDLLSIVIGVIGILSLMFAVSNFVLFLIKAWKKFEAKIKNSF